MNKPVTLPHAPSTSLVEQAVVALQDIKGKDIEVLSVTPLTSLFDTLILVSADSTRQTRALARHLEDAMRQAGHPIVGVEGMESGEWILVDLGSVIVHIMQPATRTHYDLLSLWKTPGGLRKISPTSSPSLH